MTRESRQPPPYGLVVFLAGICTMSVEMLASRLIAPFYGTSLMVWSVLLFAILASLSVGYTWGGRRADADPTAQPLSQTLLIASVLLAFGPGLCRDFLHLCAIAPTLPLLIVGLVGTVLFICIPVILLGSVGPYVIRLRTQDPSATGTGAGTVLGLSTIGSIVGTYLPALVGIPRLGTLRSFVVLSLIAGVCSLLLTRPRKRAGAVVAGICLPIVILACSPTGFLQFTPFGRFALVPVVAMMGLEPWQLDRSQGVIFEGETVYNCVQVKQQTSVQDTGHPPYSRNLLVLNEGYAVHSIATPPDAWCFPLVGSVWDYMGLLPTLSEPPGPQLDVAIVGLAGGTVARQMLELYKTIYKVSVQGAEIDPLILQVARDHFYLPPEVKAVAQDGRTFLARNPGTFDIIVTDAYRQPYIPFHLTTTEYFQLVRSHLKPSGICSINVGATSSDASILKKICSTMGAVFAEVYILEVPRASPLFTNFLVVAANRKGVIHSPTAPGNKVAAKLRAAFPKLNNELAAVMGVWSVRLNAVPPPDPGMVMTDDWAPVEMLTDTMILRTLVDPRLKLDGLQH